MSPALPKISFLNLSELKLRKKRYLDLGHTVKIEKHKHTNKQKNLKKIKIERSESLYLRGWQTIVMMKYYFKTPCI